MYVATDRTAARSTRGNSNEKRPGGAFARRASNCRPTAYVSGLQHYEARAARLAGAAAAATTRVAAATRGAAAAFATFARWLVRAFVEKQRSRAVSTRPSIAAAVSRITSETSEMIRNFARSSMRFSRNDRLFDFARNVRLLSTSATS